MQQTELQDGDGLVDGWAAAAAEERPEE